MSNQMHEDIKNKGNFSILFAIQDCAMCLRVGICGALGGESCFRLLPIQYTDLNGKR